MSLPKPEQSPKKDCDEIKRKYDACFKVCFVSNLTSFHEFFKLFWCLKKAGPLAGTSLKT